MHSSSNHISLHIWYFVLFACLSSVCLSLRICLYLTLHLLHFLVCLLALELCEREHRIILASAAVDTQAVGERVLSFNHIQITSFSLSFRCYVNFWMSELNVCMYPLCFFPFRIRISFRSSNLISTLFKFWSCQSFLAFKCAFTYFK